MFHRDTAATSKRAKASQIDSRQITAPREQTEAGSQGDSPELQRQQKIAEAAYLFSERRGFTPGCELDDWLLAEAEIDVKLRQSFGDTQIMPSDKRAPTKSEENKT